MYIKQRHDNVVETMAQVKYVAFNLRVCLYFYGLVQVYKLVVLQSFYVPNKNVE